MDSLDIIDAEIVEEITLDAPVTARKQQLDELRWLLQVLESDSSIPLPYTFNDMTWFPSDAAEAAVIAKGLGGKWAKNDPNESEYDQQYMVLSRRVDLEQELRIIVTRGLVCERKVVGTKRVKRTVTVTPAVVEERYVEVDDVEFECGSVLSAAAKLGMSRLEELTS